VKHPDFNDFSSFSNPDFLENWPRVLSRLIPTVACAAIQAIEIVAQIWKILGDVSAFDRFLLEMFRGLSNPVPALKPPIFFALANYAAVSGSARDRILSVGVGSHLVRYLEAFTSSDHVRSGLRLARTLLGCGVGDVMELADRMIPIFRCHLLHQGEKNRRLAAHCLGLLIENATLCQRCVELEVQAQLCRCVQRDPVYSDELFRAVSLLVERGYSAPFVKADLLNVLAGILAENVDVPMTTIFGLVGALMNVIGTQWEGFVPGLLAQAEKGCFENRRAAIGVLFAWIDNSGGQAIKMLANDVLLQSTIGVLQANGEGVEAIARAVLRVLEIQDEEVAATWRSVELMEALGELDNGTVFQALSSLALEQSL
jgi:hypothetical protein